jgi:hypothetical protein
LLPTDEEHVDVIRHRTAIVRRDLSQPMQLMMRFGIVVPGRSVFDYGCWQGEDVEMLSGRGFDAFGWDPHHPPGGSRKAADVLSLGFVVNVIEDARERTQTLRAAWGFARKALCVAVIAHGKVSTAGHRPIGTLHHVAGDVPEILRSAGAAHARPSGDRRAAARPRLARGVVAVFRDKDLSNRRCSCDVGRAHSSPALCRSRRGGSGRCPRGQAFASA